RNASTASPYANECSATIPRSNAARASALLVVTGNTIVSIGDGAAGAGAGGVPARAPIAHSDAAAMADHRKRGRGPAMTMAAMIPPTLIAVDSIVTNRTLKCRDATKG